MNKLKGKYEYKKENTDFFKKFNKKQNPIK